MVKRKKAKAKVFKTNSKQKAEDEAMAAPSGASASSPTMTGITMEDVKDEMDHWSNEEDARDDGGNEDIRAEVFSGEENANVEGPGQGSVVIKTKIMNSKEHNKEDVGDEDKDNGNCFVQDFNNIGMEAINCDVYANKEGIDKEIEAKSLSAHIEVDGWVVTPTEVIDATVTVGDGVGEMNEENTVYKKNCGEHANEDEDRTTGDIANEEAEDEEEDEEEDEGEDEDEDEEEYGEEENDLMDEVEEEIDQRDEMDDAHLEEEIPGIVFNKNGDEDVAGKGNCEEIGNGNKIDVGEVNCEGVVNEQKEEEIEKMTKQKIIRPRKRIRTSTVMASSAGKLVLNKKKLKPGVNEDLKEHRNGEDVRNIDNVKNNVASGNNGKQKIGVHVKGSGGEKVQVNIEKEVGESSLKKRKRLKQKGRSSLLVKESLVKIASETEGKSGLFNKKNGLLKSDTKGMIFMCSSKTKPDCYRYMVLGLPAGKREMVEQIFEGMRLFLYDVDKKLLCGIYKAAARGGYEIEPEAFNSKFPAQVRFETLEDCLPLEEKKFSKVIKDNYYTRNKFDCQLNSVQVENLCKLFRASNKDVKSERRGSRADRGFRNVREKEQEKVRVKAAPARLVDERRKVRPPPARKGRHHPERPLVLGSSRRPVRLSQATASSPQRPVRLSQATTSSYGYERTLNRREVYRGEPSVPHSEIYRRQQLEPLATYRRELLLERRETYSPDPYVDHSSTYRQEPLLVPRDSYRVEQPPLRPRDSYVQYPVLERRDYGLEPLVEHRNYTLEPLVEHRDYGLEPLPERHDPYRRQSPLLDHQDFYRGDPVLERQSRQLNLERTHPIRRGREDALSRQDRFTYSGNVYSTTQPLRTTMVPESRAVRLTTAYPSSEAGLPRYYSRPTVYQL